MHSSHIKWDVSQKQDVHRRSRKFATRLAQSSFCTLQVAGAPQRACLVSSSQDPNSLAACFLPLKGNHLEDLISSVPASKAFLNAASSPLANSWLWLIHEALRAQKRQKDKAAL